MKTIQDYTIHCTTEQTKKALELGAPIEIKTIEEAPKDWQGKACFTGMATCAKFPTAEQLIGWLEEQGISVKAMCFSWCNENKPTWQVHAYQSTTNFWDEIAFGHSKSCKEATLAAIDAALDYLIKNKK